jgi:hypothetical protein
VGRGSCRARIFSAEQHECMNGWTRCIIAVEDRQPEVERFVNMQTGREAVGR